MTRGTRDARVACGASWLRVPSNGSRFAKMGSQHDTFAVAADPSAR